jgi:signal transduction histidine kinase
MISGPAFKEAAFSYVAEKAPVLFVILSATGTILWANRYARAFAGRELSGEHFSGLILDFTESFDLCAAASDGGIEHLLNAGAASGLPQSFYFTFTEMDGHIVAFGRLDAEELERMRGKILSLNRDLGGLTRELHQKNARLERLDREKSRFLAMAAHDLRKPIGLILSYTDFLMEELEGSLDAEHAGFLQTIAAQCASMKAMVDDFLDVGAIEEGRFELERESADFPEVIEESLLANRLQAEKKGIRLYIERRGDLPRVMIDTPKIGQAAANLVANAIEHSPPGGQVRVLLSSDAECIGFSVEDEGPGISPDEAKRLFAPFEKGDAKKTGGEKSTGLGMLITRKIIEAHGGDVRIESSTGRGAAAGFSIPIATK